MLSQESVSYLEKKNEKSHLWVKAYMKVSFTGGTCTTSRIEAKHRIFKKFLNSGSSLQKIFETFAKLEKNEINNYFDEVEKFKENEQNAFKQSDLLKKLDEIYTSYAMNKVKSYFLVASNYDVDIERSNKKW